MGKNLRASLGRLCFVARALDHIMPFLSPGLAWSAVLHPSAFHLLPEAIAVLMLGIRSKIAQMSVRHCRPLRHDSGEIFRVKAKAEGDCMVIGGGESFDVCSPSEARGFSIDLGKASAPWADAKGEPFRTIAALELRGACFAFMIV